MLNLTSKLHISVFKGSPKKKKMQRRTRGLTDLRFFAKALLLSDYEIDDSKFLLSQWGIGKLEFWW